jgi:cation diffusion facilitator CzcD-associated flavoprotein CzcO
LPSIKVFEYLKAYSEKFGLIERMRLSTKVTSVARNGDGKAWDVRVQSVWDVKGEEEVVTCDKLIIAAGLNSKPNWPDVPRKDYNGMVIHTKDIGLHHQDLTSEKVKRVTVYGGCKSAVDVIIVCLMAGKKVDWVIRAEGNGPGMMGVTRKGGVHLGILAGRWKNILTPSIFATSGFWYRFLHSGNSGLGNWIFKTV